MISFRDTFEESRPRKFPYGSVPLIAPYWDDNPGDVLYRISNNQALLDKVSSHIADAFSEFSPTMLFIATWNRVPQSSSENNTQLNTFQAVIATDSNINANTTVILFLYGDIQSSSDLPSIGFNSENRSRYYNLERSTQDLETLEQTGIFAFRVDQENTQFLMNTRPMENTMESTMEADNTMESTYYVSIIPHISNIAQLVIYYVFFSYFWIW